MANKETPCRRIYWDSCVYIHRIQRSQQHIATLETLGNRIESGELILVASTLCIAEVSKSNLSGTLTAKDLRKIQAFFENRHVDVYPVTRRIAEFAANIVRLHSQKPSDAIHLATAALSNDPIHQFHTYDHKLIRLSKKIKLSSLDICEPNNDGWQQPMFPSPQQYR